MHRIESGNNYNIEVGAKANVTIEVQDGDINLISGSKRCKPQSR